MSSTFGKICGEPDLPAKFFLFLSIQDMLQTELVCKQWRNVVIECGIWKRKLQHKFIFSDIWRIFLTQHEWSSGELTSHINNKRLFMKISVILGPEELTDPLLQCIKQDTSLSWETGVALVHRALMWEEENFMAQRMNDYLILMSTLQNYSHRAKNCNIDHPSHVYLPLSISRKLSMSELNRIDGGVGSFGESYYSNLILLSPSAFPILVSKNGNIIVAGARYGKGKVVVVSHEAALCYTDIIQLAADWCANRKNSIIKIDPITR